MSKLTQAVRGLGGGGLFGTLGDLASLPGNIIHAYAEGYRQLPQRYRDAAAGRRQMQDWQARDPRLQQQQPMEPPPTMDGQNVPVDAAGMPPLPTLPPQQQGQGVRQAGYREMAPWLADGALMGVQGADNAATILRGAQPNLSAVNGVMTDTQDPANVNQRIGMNGQNINGTVVDMQDPGNANRFVGSPPVTGAEPVYGPRGNAEGPVGWRMPNGSLQAINQAAAAQQAGQTENSVYRATGPNGEPVTGYGGTLFGQAPGSGGGGQGMVSGQSPADATYRARQAEAAATQYQGYVESGRTASTRIGQLETLSRLYGDFNGNRLSGAGLELSRYARSAGFEIPENTPNIEAAQALGQQIALSFRSELPGPMSNGDREYLQAMNPSMAQTAQGRQVLIQNLVSVQRRNVEVARMARQWNDRFGRIDAPDGQGRHFDDYLSTYVEANPIFRTQPQRR